MNLDQSSLKFLQKDSISIALSIRPFYFNSDLTSHQALELSSEMNKNVWTHWGLWFAVVSTSFQIMVKVGNTGRFGDLFKGQVSRSELEGWFQGPWRSSSNNDHRCTNLCCNNRLQVLYFPQFCTLMIHWWGPKSKPFEWLFEIWDNIFLCILYAYHNLL